MSDLRTAAQQALEALKTGGWNMTTRAIADLERALAQQAEPEPMPPEQRQRWEELAAMPQQAEPVEPVAWLAPRTVDSYSRPDLGYETCSKTDYGAFAVYTAPPQRVAQQAEPVAPVAWHYRNNGGASVMHWGPSAKLDADMQVAKEYPNAHKVTPLYAAPPQRLPLTEEEIDALIYPVVMADLSYEMTDYEIARAVERAHGIKE